jgi:hypothetical protein
VYVVRWFVHVPLALRRELGRDCAHHDRGRKAHASEGDARAQYDELVAHALAAVDAADGVDAWERRAASLQRVELVQVELPPDPVQAAVGLLDDLYPTPQRAASSSAMPWRHDAERRRPAAAQLVLAHWRPARLEGEA